MKVAIRSLACGVAILATGMIVSAGSAGRSAKDILKDLAAVKITTEAEQKANPRGPIYKTARDVQLRKAELIRELYQSHPEHADVPKLIVQRWTYLINLGKPKGLAEEIEEVAAKLKDDSLKAEGTYALANKGVASRLKQDPAGVVEEVKVFLAAAPEDPRGAALLGKLAASSDASAAAEARDLLAKNFARSPEARKLGIKPPPPPAGTSTAGSTSGKAVVGEPFELEFTDAITGSPVSMAALKGKVVVVDFWATWCGPCVAEMPKMKALYARYQPKGVEFLGISLDQPEEKGGLQKLRDYVEKNEIAWPQYYQGDYWRSKFSSSLGIDSIPCVYIIDAEGKVYSKEARGKLDSLIPELLAKASKDKQNGGE